MLGISIRVKQKSLRSGLDGVIYPFALRLKNCSHTSFGVVGCAAIALHLPLLSNTIIF